MTTELVLLGTAGGPMPVPGRAGVASAVVVDGDVYLVDCGRGAPSAFADAGLDFARLRAVLLTHLHVDHIGDLAGMLLYPWGARTRPVDVVGPCCTTGIPDDDGELHRDMLVRPDRPSPGTVDLLGYLIGGFAYHLNVMPLDAPMPDASLIARARDIEPPARMVVVYENPSVRVTATTVHHGHVAPALAYRFDTADGSIVFSGDTTPGDELVELARGADVLVHEVIDLDFMERHGTVGAELQAMADLHTDVTRVGAIAQRAGVGELVLNHYLPADPTAIADHEWAARAGAGFGGLTVAGVDGMRRTLTRATAPSAI
jgi:ribonuclease BN (tRNA processing enzyme)